MVDISNDEIEKKRINDRYYKRQNMDSKLYGYKKKNSEQTPAHTKIETESEVDTYEFEIEKPKIKPNGFAEDFKKSLIYVEGQKPSSNTYKEETFLNTFNGTPGSNVKLTNKNRIRSFKRKITEQTATPKVMMKFWEKKGSFEKKQLANLKDDGFYSPTSKSKRKNIDGI